MKETFKKEKREKGVTLLEVMIAIVILTFGILAVATMQSTAIQGNLLGYRYTEAANLAQDRLEHLLTLPYTDTLWNEGSGQSDPLTTPAGYTITYDVTNLDIEGGTDNAKSLRVSVAVIVWAGSVSNSLTTISSRATEPSPSVYGLFWVRFVAVGASFTGVTFRSIVPVTAVVPFSPPSTMFMLMLVS